MNLIHAHRPSPAAFGAGFRASPFAQFGTPVMEREAGAKPGSREYIRWVQTSLNRILGLKLSTDGLMGAATRSAIRDFQKSRGLAADGQVGSATEAALRAALGAGPAPAPAPAPVAGRACTRPRLRGECLDDFDFDRDLLKPGHLTQIRDIAQCIADSQGTCTPIFRVVLVGHTDPVGSVAYNIGLGRRRAERVRAELARVLEGLRPGLAGRPNFLNVDSRGESEPVDLNPARAALNRRVEVFLSNTVAAGGRCAPNKARVRLHLKILQDPCIAIPVMIENMKCLYGLAGFLVDVASTERLNLPPLLDVDLRCPGAPLQTCCPFPCESANLNPAHVALFGNRNRVGADELTVYFVRSTFPALNGCCAHPPGRPGVIVASVASEWTLAHEVGHVLGLSHVDENVAGGRRLLDRLMTGGGTANVQGIPRLLPCEIRTMDRSRFTIDC